MKLDNLLSALSEEDRESVLSAGDQVIEALRDHFPDKPNLSYLSCLVAADVLKEFVKIIYAVPGTETRQ